MFLEQAEFLSKEEARQRYIAKMQEQYEKEAAARAEKVKQVIVHTLKCNYETASP